MRVLITGSSGQIGTNLALRLLGRRPRGVRRRQAPEHLGGRLPDAAPGSRGPLPAFRGGIGGVEYPEVDLVVHLAAHAKVHQLVRQPHRALENAIMTFNVLEYARALGLPLDLLVDPRGVRRRPPLRGVLGGGSRLRLHGEPVLGVEDHQRGVHLLLREAATGCATSSSASRTCTDATTTTSGAWTACSRSGCTQLSRDEPITIFGGEEKLLDFTYIDDCVDGIARGVYRLQDGSVSNQTDQPRVRAGQLARPGRRADRDRAGRRSEDEARTVAAR